MQQSKRLNKQKASLMVVKRPEPPMIRPEPDEKVVSEISQPTIACVGLLICAGYVMNNPDVSEAARGSWVYKMHFAYGLVMMISAILIIPFFVRLIIRFTTPKVRAEEDPLAPNVLEEVPFAGFIGVSLEAGLLFWSLGDGEGVRSMSLEGLKVFRLSRSSMNEALVYLKMSDGISEVVICAFTSVVAAKEVKDYPSAIKIDAKYMISVAKHGSKHLSGIAYALYGVE